MKPSTFALTTITSLILAACGGGGSPTTASSLSGIVIDGYIEGATVCLDLNNNQACDSGEPSKTTDKDGSYSLDTSGLTTAQIKAAHLLTVVPTTAKDADDNGKTLAEAGKSGFNLLAPAASYVGSDGSAVTGAVISPLTTLVSHEMIAANNLPLATAEANVRTRMNLAANTDLRKDFVAAKDATLTEKAQMVAMTVAEVKKAALADTTAKATDQQALLAALDYLRTQVATLQAEYEKAKASASVSGTPTPAQVLQAVKTATKDKVDTATFVNSAKQTTDSTVVSAIGNMLQAGFYGADRVLESCGTGINMTCTPNYWKVSGSNGKFTTDNDFTLSNGTWVKDSNQGNDLRLTDKGWVSDSCTGGTYTEDGTGAATINCSGWSARVTAREVDASGKTLKALGLTVPSNYADTTPMPTGAKLYWFSFADINDRYDLYTGNKVQQWSTTTNTQVSFTSLEQLIAANGAGTPGLGWSGLRFTFDAGGTSNGGTVTLLDYINWSSKTAIGTAKYEIRTVHGQQVLVILKPAPQNSDGSYVMFAVKDGAVYGGSYRSSAMASQSEGTFNKTMMNAILAAGGKPAVID